MTDFGRALSAGGRALFGFRDDEAAWADDAGPLAWALEPSRGMIGAVRVGVCARAEGSGSTGGSGAAAGCSCAGRAEGTGAEGGEVDPPEDEKAIKAPTATAKPPITAATGPFRRRGGSDGRNGLRAIPVSIEEDDGGWSSDREGEGTAAGFRRGVMRGSDGGATSVASCRIGVGDPGGSSFGLGGASLGEPDRTEARPREP